MCAQWTLHKSYHEADSQRKCRVHVRRNWRRASSIVFAQVVDVEVEGDEEEEEVEAEPLG